MPLQRFLNTIYGEEPEFSLKEIAFHKICAIGTGALMIALPFALAINELDLVLLILACQAVLVIFYWCSRIMRKFMIGWLGFSITSYAFFIANYFLNSGLDGTTVVMSFITLAMLFATSDSKHHWLWSTLHAIVFSGLIFYEYKWGNFIVNSYENEAYRFIDNAAMYIISVGFFYLIFNLIRGAYEDQQEQIKEQHKELSLQQTELQKSNTDLTKLLSIIAHDVRNPLASLQGYLELLQLEDLSLEERKEMEKDLLRMVIGTSHMLDDMVHWSKGQLNAEQNTNFKRVSLGSWLNSTVEQIRSMAHAKGLSLTDDYPGMEKVYCDPNLMTVVIRNLLQNAIKFSPKEKLIELKVYRKEKNICFEVIDQGIGIPSEKIPSLFSGKTESSLGTSNELGTGFGLGIVKEYVDLHRGTVEVFSEEGLGSTFKVCIPRKAPKPIQSPGQ